MLLDTQPDCLHAIPFLFYRRAMLCLHAALLHNMAGQAPRLPLQTLQNSPPAEWVVGMQVVLAYGAESNRQLGIEGEVHHRKPCMLFCKAPSALHSCDASLPPFLMLDNRIILYLCI